MPVPPIPGSREWLVQQYGAAAGGKPSATPPGRLPVPPPQRLPPGRDPSSPPPQSGTAYQYIVPYILS